MLLTFSWISSLRIMLYFVDMSNLVNTSVKLDRKTLVITDLFPFWSK